MELDVPADVVSQGKDAIREYVAKVTLEVRGCVEDALRDVRVEQQEREPAPAPEPRTPRGAPNGRVNRRPIPNGRAAVRSSPRARVAPNGHSNGHENGDAASVKQINYLRSLATEAGYSGDQLAYLAQEVVGKDDIRSLSKRDASALIDQLRGDKP